MSEAETGAIKVDEALEKKLEEYYHLKPLAGRYEKLKKELKPVFEGTERIAIGRFIVTGRYKSMKEKIIPACTYWDMQVEPKTDFSILAAAQEGAG